MQVRSASILQTVVRFETYCRQRGVRIFGDVPIFVAHDSADVWAHPELFELAADGRPGVVAGVPPDYFSATGQLWGNPLYRWDVLSQTGYAWWIERLRATLAMVDIVRLDHFRGFEAYWETPAAETTAINGRWVKGPGASFFEAVNRALGDLPVVAENLGLITPEVERLREQFGFPGMAILQFAFGTDPQGLDLRPIPKTSSCTRAPMTTTQPWVGGPAQAWPIACVHRRKSTGNENSLSNTSGVMVMTSIGLHSLCLGIGG
jgi:4-alpha-glucanotransferase